jgi:hypothetical protein
MLTYTLNDINSLAMLSGDRDVSSFERLKPPKPPDISSKRCSAEFLQYVGGDPFLGGCWHR